MIIITCILCRKIVRTFFPSKIYQFSSFKESREENSCLFVYEFLAMRFIRFVLFEDIIYKICHSHKSKDYP